MQRNSLPPKRPRKRLRDAVGRWLMRRLQRRIEKEWRDYEQPPEVLVGPFFKRRASNEGTHIYRSLVQIHFHKEKPR